MLPSLVPIVVRLAKQGYSREALALLQASSQKNLTFADLVEKFRWFRLSGNLLQESPYLLQNLFDLVQIAYSPIGGHIKVRRPSDLIKELDFIIAIDIDADPEADALLMGKEKGRYIKFTTIGHDGVSGSKREAISHFVKLLKQGKAFSEVSGKMADLFFTKMRLKSVDDEDRVEKILNKSVDWVGPHPEGKYPKNLGWYFRTIGGERVLKSLMCQ